MSLQLASSLVKRVTTTPFHSLGSPLPFLGQFHRMSSTSLLQRNIQDHKRRLLADKYELRRKLHKAFTKDPDLSIEMRDKHRYKLSKLPRNSAFSRVRNRCVYTGRARSVYQFFRMSRIVFRGLASRGALMGIKKASCWMIPWWYGFT